MKFYLSIFFGLFTFSSLGLFLVLLKVSPNDFPILSLVFFYSLFFLISFSFFTLVGYITRRIISPTVNKYISFTLSFRQALLLAIFTNTSAAMLQFKIFSWFIEIILFLFIIFLEFYFMISSEKKAKR